MIPMLTEHGIDNAYDSDIDGDGKKDEEDGDGDGKTNDEDDDIDGDSTRNEVDESAAGPWDRRVSIEYARLSRTIARR